MVEVQVDETELPKRQSEEVELQEVSVDKKKLRGKCITCRRGFFTFYMVWCMHPKLPSGYKAHSPFDTCSGYELSQEFKFMANFFKMQNHEKYVRPFIEKRL